MIKPTVLAQAILLLSSASACAASAVAADNLQDFPIAADSITYLDGT